MPNPFDPQDADHFEREPNEDFSNETPTLQVENTRQGFAGREVREMSDEELRVKVAELCGWKTIRTSQFDGRLIGNRELLFGAAVPNYPADLNAMHEAEKVMSYGQLWEYHHQLHELKGMGGNNYWRTFHATARQRAEAFVLTLSPQPVASPDKE